MTNEPTKRYWRGPDERDRSAAIEASPASEFQATPEEMAGVLADPEGGARDRRWFLKSAGFTIGGSLALSACSRGVEEKLVPLLTRPEGATPGRTLWYATTCGACAA